MSGYYLMYRGWMENEVFADEAFTEREAWEWMIARARWEPGMVNILGRPTALDRGQFSDSLRFMAARFKWSKSAVERFVDKLVLWDMVKDETGTGQKIITICNYSIYQDIPTDDRDRSGTQTGTGAGQERDKEEYIKPLKKEYIQQGVARDPQTSAFRRIFDFGTELFPALASRNTASISKWVAAGADPELDVLPTLTAAKGKEIKSWIYFDGAVMDALAYRLKPLPEGKTHEAHSPIHPRRPGKSEEAKAAILRGLGLGAEG